jgi:membrane fusion protein (multidrug efflux system)
MTLPRSFVLLTLCAALPSWAAQNPAAAPPAPVIAAEVRTEPFADRVEALGTLRANESVSLTANVTETVSVIHFDDGQQVKRGEVLVEMTSAEEHALLEEARARLAEAQRQYDRVKSLVTQRSASESLLDERRRDLDTARALLVAIESRLADRLIKAPFDGILGLRNISPGALVTPGDLITTLDDTGVMKLDFTVPSVFLRDLAPGLAIEARAPAYGERTFEGAVRSIDSRVDPVTRSVRVRALIPNPDGTLKPGVLMRVELLRNPRETLVVPESALLQKGRDHHVMRIDADAKAERVAVKGGARRPGQAEILEGLSAGDRVITHGADKVRPGQAVRVQAMDDGTRPLAELVGARP